MTTKLPTHNEAGLRVVWEWEPWARFLRARAELIHQAVGNGEPAEEIAARLSCEPTQVRLLAATELRTICGLPGAVWPPAEHQKPEAK